MAAVPGYDNTYGNNSFTLTSSQHGLKDHPALQLLWAALFTFNPYLLISINELLISINELLISINEL